MKSIIGVLVFVVEWRTFTTLECPSESLTVASTWLGNLRDGIEGALARGGADGWGTSLQAWMSRVIGIFPNPSGRTMALGSTQPLTEMSKGKGKVIPLQAQCGPEGSRRFILPDFHEIWHMKVVRS